jgi:hypothetical protein
MTKHISLKLRAAFLLLPLVLLSSLTSTIWAATWRTNAPMSLPRQFHAAVTLPSGAVLVAGGDSVPGEATASAEIFSPNSNTWASTGNMQEPRMLFTLTGLTNGLVLAVGGQNNAAGPLNSCELFDPLTGTWELTASMVSARSAHTATLLTNGYVLIAGGRSEDGVVAAEIFDVPTKSWSAAGPMNTPREFHTATLLNDGRVLVVGGRNELADPLDSAELYNPAADSWQPVMSMNSPRRSHTATFLPTIGKVLVVGGEALGGELFDPTANIWTDLQIGGEANALRGHSATLLPNGLVLIAAGLDEASENPLDLVSKTAWLYYPTTSTWSPPFLLYQGRCQHTATPLANGRVLVTGGGSFSAPFRLDTAEIFDPIAPINLVASFASPPAIQIAFTNTPGFAFRILMTTNLPTSVASWTELGSVSEISPGQYEFTDAAPANNPMRFYRVQVN